MFLFPDNDNSLDSPVEENHLICQYLFSLMSTCRLQEPNYNYKRVPAGEGSRKCTKPVDSRPSLKKTALITMSSVFSKTDQPLIYRHFSEGCVFYIQQIRFNNPRGSVIKVYIRTKKRAYSSFKDFFL